MHECEAVAEELPIRQGDIFVSHPTDQQRCIYVVITADCDFAQNKVGKNAVCLPIIASSEYAVLQWKRAKLGAAAIRLKKKRADIVALYAAKKFAGFSNISVETVDEWFADRIPGDIIVDLAITGEDEEQLNKIIAFIKQVEELQNDSGSIDKYVKAYYEILESIDLGLSVPKQVNKARDLTVLLSEEKVDYFYLNEVSGLEGGGWYVDLRDVRLLPIVDLMQSRQRWLENADSFFRTGRLKDVYKYALTQKFGGLFARIGLPAVHEQWKPQILGGLSESAFVGEPIR